jgi:phosphinothricin acetyltransferase
MLCGPAVHDRPAEAHPGKHLKSSSVAYELHQERRPGNPAGACGYRMAMKQDPRSGQGGPAQVKITAGTEDDLVAIVGILNYTAANSIASFETRPVSAAERRDWFGRFSATGPYQLVVARGGDQVLGFACSQRYRDHEAFRETVEVSIALDAGSRGQGVGTALYRVLFDSLALEPSVHVALAGIALPNDASVALHRKFGFTEVGMFREYAIKNGQYISSVWMQRACRPAPPSGQQPVP